MGKRLAWKALAVTLAVSLIMSFCAVSAFADDGTQDEAEEGIARTQVDPSEEETASAEGESVEETVPESGDTESEIATETPEPEAVSQPEENLSEPEASQNAEATETDLQPADSDPQDGASIFDSINSTDSDEIVIEIDGDHAIFEVPIPKSWLGKTIGQVDIRKKFSINILAVKTGRKLDCFITPDLLLTEEKTLMVMGKYKDLQKCFKI